MSGRGKPGRHTYGIKHSAGISLGQIALAGAAVACAAGLFRLWQARRFHRDELMHGIDPVMLERLLAVQEVRNETGAAPEDLLDALARLLVHAVVDPRYNQASCLDSGEAGERRE